jgi:acyl-CoA thioesterase-1
MIFKTFFICLLLGLLSISSSVNSDKKIKYVALGDSYTICEGAKEDQAWPTILAKDLTDNGVTVELVANPSRTGWTTEDLIDNELQICEQNKPDFVTLLIGVNDWVQQVDIETYHRRLIFIIDKVEALLPNKKNLLLVTIPDFGVTPTGAMYSGGRDITEGIKKFNSIIVEEAKKRNLETVDVFPETQKMKGQADLIARDGLHPSAKEYAIWEKMIYPFALKLLKSK